MLKEIGLRSNFNSLLLQSLLVDGSSMVRTFIHLSKLWRGFYVAAVSEPEHQCPNHLAVWNAPSGTPLSPQGQGDELQLSLLRGPRLTCRSKSSPFLGIRELREAKRPREGR